MWVDAQCHVAEGATQPAGRRSVQPGPGLSGPRLPSHCQANSKSSLCAECLMNKESVNARVDISPAHGSQPGELNIRLLEIKIYTSRQVPEQGPFLSCADYNDEKYVMADALEVLRSSENKARMVAALGTRDQGPGTGQPVPLKGKGAWKTAHATWGHAGKVPVGRDRGEGAPGRRPGLCLPRAGAQ